MDDTTRQRLDDFVRARNANRSAEAAADGFTSGRRIDSLRIAEHEQRKALMAIAEWVEAEARKALGLPPTPTR